jgi:hypothetical protein
VTTAQESPRSVREAPPPARHRGQPGGGRTDREMAMMWLLAVEGSVASLVVLIGALVTGGRPPKAPAELPAEPVPKRPRGRPRKEK